MLDTNTVSYILRDQSPKARKRLEHLSEEEEVCVSAITEGEIRYGLAKLAVKPETRDTIERFLEAIDILPWDSEVARVYDSSETGSRWTADQQPGSSDRFARDGRRSRACHE